MSLDNLTTLFIVFDCEEKFLKDNQSMKAQEMNSIQIYEDLKKYQRSRSSAQQKNNLVDDENTCISKFSLKR